MTNNLNRKLHNSMTISLNDLITYDRFCFFVQSVLDAVNGSNNALAAGDFSIFNWNIEVNTEIRKEKLQNR